MTISTSDEGHAIEELSLSSGSLLQLRARDVRLERTGLHAHLAFLLNKKLLAHSVFNVWRDEERNRMVRGAHKLFGEMDREAYPLETFIHAVNVYVLELEIWLKAQFQASFRQGDTSNEPARFTLFPYLPEGGGTILFGPPGKGKSWMALLMAIAVDAGLNGMWQTTGGRALYINLERPPISLDRRLAQANAALGLAPERELLFLHARGKGLLQVADGIRESIAQHAVKCIVLDSISRAGLGTLLDDRTANNIIDILNSLGISWLALGHSPRADDSHLFGSVHFDAGQDVGVRLVSEQRDAELGVGLEIVKANDMAPQGKQFYSLKFDAAGLTVFEKAREQDFPNLWTIGETSLPDLIGDYLSEVSKATTTEIAKALGKDTSNIGKVLRNDKEFIALPREGREVYYSLRLSRPEGEEVQPLPF